jgi:hypothetical protein
MVVANNEMNETKNAGKSTMISMATSPDGAHPGLYLKPLVAAIGRVPAPYHPDGRHGQRI